MPTAASYAADPRISAAAQAQAASAGVARQGLPAYGPTSYDPRSVPNNPAGYDAAARAAAAAGYAPTNGVVPQGQPGTPQGAMARPAGPPAWNEQWRQKFIALGVPSEMVQQLTFSGAQGADEAQLTQLHGEMKGQVDGLIAELEKKFPEQYKELNDKQQISAQVLQAVGATNKQELMVRLAMANQQGQLTKEMLDQVVQGANASMGKMFKDMFLKQILPWTVIPGWGAIRFVASPFFGGKDFISGDDIHLDFWNYGMQGWFDGAFAILGAVSLYNTARGALAVHKGLNMMQTNPAAASIAAKDGVKFLANGKLGMGDSMLAYLPSTHMNQVATGITRFNDDIINTIGKLPAGSTERQLGDLFLTRWKAGEIGVRSSSGWGQMPFLSDKTRGSLPLIDNRGAKMVQVAFQDGKTVFNLNPAAVGPGSVPLIIGKSIHLLPDAEYAKLSEQMMAQAAKEGKSIEGLLTAAGKAGKPPVAMLEHWVTGNAARQLMDAGALTQRFSSPLLNRIYAVVRPGALEDSLAAAAQPLFQPSVTTQIMTNPWFKRLLIGTAVGGGYYFFVKKPQDAAKQAAAQQQTEAEAQAAAQQGGAAPGTGAQAQMTPELQSVIAQFQKMPPEQQAAFVQQNVQKLQQAAQQPNLTPQDKALIEQRFAELELLVQSVQGAVAPQGATPAGLGGLPAGTIDAAAGQANTQPGSNPLVPQLPAGVSTSNPFARAYAGA